MLQSEQKKEKVELKDEPSLAQRDFQKLKQREQVLQKEAAAKSDLDPVVKERKKSKLTFVC